VGGHDHDMRGMNDEQLGEHVNGNTIKRQSPGLASDALRRSVSAKLGKGRGKTWMVDMQQRPNRDETSLEPIPGADANAHVKKCEKK